MLILLTLPGDDLPSANDWMNKIFFDKWVHAGIFGLLALLFMWPVGISNIPKKIKGRNFIDIALLALVWAFITECIQLYIPLRSFDLIDWLADSFGILVALLFSKKYFIE